MCTLNLNVYVKTFALKSLSKKLVLSGSGVAIERLKDEFRFNENHLIPGSFQKISKKSLKRIAEMEYQKIAEIEYQKITFHDNFLQVQ